MKSKIFFTYSVIYLLQCISLTILAMIDICLYTNLPNIKTPNSENSYRSKQRTISKSRKNLTSSYATIHQTHAGYAWKLIQNGALKTQNTQTGNVYDESDSLTPVCMGSTCMTGFGFCLRNSI